MILLDSHEDLAWNMLSFGRDYTLPVAETRRREHGGLAPSVNGDTLLGWPEYQQGCVALVFSTLFAAPMRRKLGAWDTQCYVDAQQARTIYRLQLDAYQRLAGDHPEKFHMVHTKADLKAVLDPWESAPAAEHPVGLVLSMEGAECVRQPAELEEWWQAGVRLVGPAWAGTRFCGGTQEPGPLTAEGYALLEGMAALGFTLDLSHMDERAALQALDEYPRQLVATHANASALLKGNDSNRHLSERLIQGLVERGGIIGVVPYNSFLKVGWSRREEVTLQHLVDQVDHVCQIAGDARHVGIGTDFDGGFGVQSVPAEIDTIADLQKLVPLLAQAGYAPADVAAILGGNWTSILQGTLPESV